MTSGYKQTQIGVIPQEWDVVALDAACRMKSGEGITAASIDHVSQYPCYGGNGLRGYTSRFTHDGSFALIGRQGALCGNVVGVKGKFFASEHALVVTAKEGTNIRFLTYVLGRMRLNRFSESSAQPGLSVSKLLGLPLAIPPAEAEQLAIATALSGVDGLLGGLDRLIAKKRDLQQAAMQQFLTGQSRLPGFSGEWETTTLGGVADIRNGATPSTRIAAFWNGSIPWCTPTDITGTPGKYLLTTERNITTEGLIACAASLLPAGALLVCSRATIGEIKIAASPVCTNQGFKSLVCKDGVSNEFLYYLLVTLKPQMIERAVGSTFLEIGKRDVAAIEVRMPPCNEQHAIASILCDMDAEIAALERRRDKTRAIKKAMMQELLTGRTRLI